ncbi:MAG: hypothetical protein QMC97_04000 [Pseudothermotoga sp.]|uniref:hypothetical protein n=1 Tax=Pseudothermotoga sp. TaxID=2033661 RepID=UPI00258F364F|nr:hypothetical protein [Pseudothermotoga sp.]MDI6862526.1 hypothetical protein [Pseudothermotoga sp.]
MAGLGTGVIDKPERIKEWVKYKEPVEPRSENKKVYDRYYQIYLQLYERTKDLMEAL